MKIRTERGTWETAWIDCPITRKDQVMMEITDERRIPSVAADFDGLHDIVREDDEQGNKTFSDYADLIHISRETDGSVMVILQKANEVNGND